MVGPDLLYNLDIKLQTNVTPVIIDQLAYDSNGQLEVPASKSYGFNSCSNLPWAEENGLEMAARNGKSQLASLILRAFMP
jgi:hypothetical protein